METTAPSVSEEVHTNFKPLGRLPLRFQGIFGVAWQLYKRSFKGLAPLCVLLYALPFLLAYLPMLLSMDNVFSHVWDYGIVESIPGFPGSIFSMFGFTILSYVLLLGLSFVLAPAISATMYMEMDQCMDGRRGSFSQLVKAAFKVGLRYFYTTFLAQYVVMLGINVATSFVSYLLFFVLAIPMSLAASVSGAFPAALMCIMFVFLLLVMVVGLCFTSLVYPVAVHERLRGFRAVGRAMSLAAKRFWRVFSVMLVYMLVILLILALVSTPFVISIVQLAASGNTPDISHMFGGFAIFLGAYILLLALLMPYDAALRTALYVDASSRSYSVPERPQPPEGGPVYGRPVE